MRLVDSLTRTYINPLNWGYVIIVTWGKFEDEYNFMLECPLYKSLRQQFFKTITNSNGYFGSYCPHNKFIWIMTTEDVGTLNQLDEFIINCFLLRKG